MEPINCNANDSSRQIDTLKRSENNSSLQHVITHTRKTNEKNKRSRVARHPHTHTHIDVPPCVHSKIRTLTDNRTITYVSVLFGQSI